MNPRVDLAISLLTAGSMLAVGIEIALGDIYYVLTQKVVLLRLLISQIVFLPALAILVIHFISVSNELKIVALVLFACPTGNLASFFTLIARGNLALTVVSSACSCLLAPVIMPAIFWLDGRLWGSQSVFTTPQGLLLTRIILITWIPILLGILLRRLSSAKAGTISKLLQKAGASGILGLCICILMLRFRYFSSELKADVEISAILIVLSIMIAATISRLLGLKWTESICYVTAFPARNFGILAVSVTVMHRAEGLDLGFIYFVLECLIVLSIIGIYRWRSSHLPARLEISNKTLLD